MPKKPETIFRERVSPKIDGIPNAFFFSIQQQSIRGTPDKLGVVQGWFIALEFKKDKASRPTPLQDYNLRRVAEAGGFSIVCYPENWDAVFQFLAYLSEKGRDYDRNHFQKIAPAGVHYCFPKGGDEHGNSRGA